MKYFSPQLIERTQKYFLKRFGTEITVVEAEEYLHSFADLYLAFSNIPPQDSLPAPPKAAGK